MTKLEEICRELGMTKARLQELFGKKKKAESKSREKKKHQEKKPSTRLPVPLLRGGWCNYRSRVKTHHLWCRDCRRPKELTIGYRDSFKPHGCITCGGTLVSTQPPDPKITIAKPKKSKKTKSGVDGMSLSELRALRKKLDRKLQTLQSILSITPENKEGR